MTTKKSISLLIFIVMSACALPSSAAQRLAQLKKANVGQTQSLATNKVQEKIDAIVAQKISKLLGDLKQEVLATDEQSDVQGALDKSVSGKVLLRDIKQDINNQGIQLTSPKLAHIVCDAFKKHLNANAQSYLFYSPQNCFHKVTSTGTMMSLAYNANDPDFVRLLMNLGADPYHTIVTLTPSKRPDLSVEILNHYYLLNNGASDRLRQARDILMARAVAKGDVKLVVLLKHFAGVDLNTTTSFKQTILGSYCSNEQYHACKGEGLDKKTSQTINKLMRLGCDPLQMSVVFSYNKETDQSYKSQATPYDYLCSLKHDEQLSESCKSFAHDIAQKIKNNNRQFLMHGMSGEKKYTDVSIHQAHIH